jgi:hypothetical protein
MIPVRTDRQSMPGTMTIARTMTDDHERQQFLDNAKAFYLKALTIT